MQANYTNSLRYLYNPTRAQYVNMVRRLVAQEMELDKAIHLVAYGYAIKEASLRKWFHSIINSENSQE